jgi:hypothetical protein
MIARPTQLTRASDLLPPQISFPILRENGIFRQQRCRHADGRQIGALISSFFPSISSPHDLTGERTKSDTNRSLEEEWKKEEERGTEWRIYGSCTGPMMREVESLSLRKIQDAEEG